MTFNYQGSQALPQVPVIPSNSSAPVWAEAGDKSALNRVLIARSCNVPSGHGQHVLQTGGSHYFKNENCYPMLQSKLGGRIPSYRPSLPLERRITEHEYERQARRLYSRFLQKSGYQSYRNRQPKKGKKQGDTVWPDEMEHAFFRALVRFPPVGRKKDKPAGREHEKQMGRNEIIADFVYSVTGVTRRRKQVSSHIQVLKDMIKGDPYLMAHLVSPKGQAPGEAKAKYRIDQVTYSGAHATQPYSNAPRDEYIDKMIQLTFSNFEMFAILKKIDKTSGAVLSHETVHTYTKSHEKCQLEDFHFQSIADCKSAYPELADMRLLELANRNLFAINASLDIPTARFNILKDSELDLGIFSLVEGPLLPQNSCMKSLTTFFVDGIRREEQSGSGDAGIVETTDLGRCSYQLPFCSKSWARSLQQIGITLQRAYDLVVQPLAAAETAESRDIAVSTIKQDVANTIQSITAVQEIVVTKEDGTDPKTVLGIHWSFSKAAEGDYGRISWHNLVVPLEEALPEVIDEDFNTEMRYFESTGICNSYDPFEVPIAQYPPVPSLQSPIEFTGSAAEKWGLPSGEETKFEDSKPEVPKYEDVKYDSNWLENVQGAQNVDNFDFGEAHLDMPYDQSCTLGHYGGELSVVDFDISALAHDPLLQQYNHQWTGYENVFDAAGDLSYTTSQTEGTYPTPPSATDMVKFESFGSQDQQQALAGGSFEVKEEDHLDVTLKFD